MTTRLKMFLDVKVLFSNLNLVRAPAFSSRIKALRMTGYSLSYPVNASENGNFKLSLESCPV